MIKSFQGSVTHHQNWIDSIKAAKIDAIRGAECGHYSAALAHLGGVSLALGKKEDFKTWSASNKNPLLGEAAERMAAHLDANQVDLDKTPLSMGAPLSFDPKTELFTGELAEKANPLLKGSYRKEFSLPI